MVDIEKKRCVPCEGGVAPLTEAEITKYLKKLHATWDVRKDHKELSRLLKFKDFHHTMDFVNAVAKMAHEENHHPDLEVGYNYCKVRYSTHAIGGLSENDIICAIKVDRLSEA